MDLSPSHQFDGLTKAPVCTTWDVKEVLGCIGGVPALFPILETVSQSDGTISTILADPLMSPVPEKPDVDGWEVLPSTSYAGSQPIFRFKYLIRINTFTVSVDRLEAGTESRFRVLSIVA